MMKIEIIPVLKDNYAYILTTTDGTCAIVDPGEADPVIHALEQRKQIPKFILNTHHHGDHVAGNAKIKNKYCAKIIAPAKEADKIGNVDQTVSHGQHTKLGNEDVEIAAAEGHTAGGIFYHFPQSKVIFTGDTLFSLGCGRLFEGTAQQMYDALQYLKTLPPETRIYCGHEYTLAGGAFCLSEDPDNQDLKQRLEDVRKLREQNKPSLPTTIGQEIKTNIFMKAKSAEEFAALRKKKDNF